MVWEVMGCHLRERLHAKTGRQAANSPAREVISYGALNTLDESLTQHPYWKKTVSKGNILYSPICVIL